MGTDSANRLKAEAWAIDGVRREVQYGKFAAGLQNLGDNPMELAMTLQGVYSLGKLGATGLKTLGAAMRAGGDDAARAIAGSVDEFVLTTRGNAVPATKFGGTASNNLGNLQKMTTQQLDDFLGKGWHQNGGKSKIFRENIKKLKGATNADFMCNPKTGEVYLMGNKGGAVVPYGNL